MLSLSFLALCTEEDKGGLAVGYDYEDEQTEPTTYKKKYKKPETRNSETKGCVSLLDKMLR